MGGPCWGSKGGFGGAGAGAGWGAGGGGGWGGGAACGGGSCWGSGGGGGWANGGGCAWGASAGGWGGPSMGMGKGGGSCWGQMMAMGGKGMKGYGGPSMAFSGFGGGGGGKDIYGPPSGGYSDASEPISSMKVVWVALRQASQITSEGFPPEAPALTYDKAHPLFSSAHSILQELVSDVSTDVQIVHDPDWEQFPEVAQALREAGAEENCLSVGTCPQEAKWAIGLGGGKIGRERAVKAALALSIAAGTERVEKLASQYSEFASLCMDAGILAARPARQSLGWKGGKDSGFGGAASTGKKKRNQQEAYGPPETAPEAAPTGEESPPSVTWLNVDTNSKLREAGFPTDGPAVSHEKAYAEAFKSAHHVLTELVGGDVAAAVQFTHDPDWVEFPEVGKAMKEAGAEENCFCVATYPAGGKWAVGIANGWKGRESASKLSLCLALANDEESFSNLCKQYPDFGRYLAIAGLVPNSEPKKKRKVEPKPKLAVAPPQAAVSSSEGLMANGVGFAFGAGVVKAGTTRGSPPTDTPLLVQLPSSKALKEPLSDLPREGLVVGSHGECRQDLYDSAEKVLSNLLGDPEADVHIFDDPNWEQFPEVAEALYGGNKDPAFKGPRSIEEQLMVAVCTPAGLWAAGFGAKYKSREQAAKVALAATLVMRSSDAGEVPDLSGIPPFEEFMKEVMKA
uniref:Uncharacterized protein n=1 Tax=Alexandrium monilatum TaxID=311494 RepID=A0A7S4QSC1_9DINO